MGNTVVGKDLAAILLDGGFVKKVLRERFGHFPTVGEVADLCERIMAHDDLREMGLLRIYFYDAEPFKGKARNPISKKRIDYAITTQASENESLIQSLELQPNFAVRRGVLVMHGWKLKRIALATLARGPNRPIAEQDLTPDFQQKGVDMRIGLDVASLALKKLVSAIILVTGDSDMVPAMKMARREGIRVYLYPVEKSSIRRELKAHADILLKGILSGPRRSAPTVATP